LVEKLKGGIILARIPPEKYVDSVLSIMGDLSKEGRGIYITASRPYEVFSPLLKNNGINVENVFFIDCLSSITGIPVQEKNVRYIPTPTMLELITMHVDLAMAEKEIKFVVLDSVSSLAIYNSERAMIEFLHFLILRMRQKKVKTVMLAIGADHIVPSLSMLCDQVVKYE